MSDKYTIHNEVGLHFVTFTVVDWVAGPETVIWLVNPSHLPGQTPTKAKAKYIQLSSSPANHWQVLKDFFLLYSPSQQGEHFN
jgi:hypothetical protein